MQPANDKHNFVTVSFSRDDLLFIARVLVGAGQSYQLFGEDANLDGNGKLAKEEYDKAGRCFKLSRAIALVGKTGQGE